MTQEKCARSIYAYEMLPPMPQELIVSVSAIEDISRQPIPRHISTKELEDAQNLWSSILAREIA